MDLEESFLSTLHIRCFSKSVDFSYIKLVLFCKKHFIF